MGYLYVLVMNMSLQQQKIKLYVGKTGSRQNEGEHVADLPSIPKGFPFRCEGLRLFEARLRRFFLGFRAQMFTLCFIRCRAPFL